MTPTRTHCKTLSRFLMPPELLLPHPRMKSFYCLLCLKQYGREPYLPMVSHTVVRAEGEPAALLKACAVPQATMGVAGE